MALSRMLKRGVYIRRNVNYGNAPTQQVSTVYAEISIIYDSFRENPPTKKLPRSGSGIFAF